MLLAYFLTLEYTHIFYIVTFGVYQYYHYTFFISTMKLKIIKKLNIYSKHIPNLKTTRQEI